MFNPAEPIPREVAMELIEGGYIEETYPGSCCWIITNKGREYFLIHEKIEGPAN